MVADPAVILPDLLALPQLKGKDDSGLTRLKQYKNLEQKSVNRAASNLETEDFLRECNIRVDIKHDIESDFDRIVELANRTNQLNFTKIRVETQAMFNLWHIRRHHPCFGPLWRLRHGRVLYVAQFETH